MNEFYRIDLAARCPGLNALDPHLITRWRVSNLVCSPLDWDLRVSRGVGLDSDACIVKAQTPLTRAEADAIPHKFKP